MIAEPPIPELGWVAANAITEVLATQFKLSAIALTPADEPVTGTPKQYLIGSVTLSGGRVSGDVHLQLPEAFAAKLTALLFGRSATSVTDEGAADVTGERILPLKAEKGPPISALAMSADARRVAWGDEDGNAGVTEVG